MKTEIVKYHNDLNKIIFPNFREQELNIFNNVMQRVFDRGDEVVEFSAEEVSKFFGSAYNKKLLAWMLHTMGERMSKIGFKFISEKNNQSRRAFFTIFPTFEVKAEKNEKFIDDLDKYTLTSLKVRVNRDFLYLFNELIGKYTKYELSEFMDIGGKYAKRLYMTLKQYRNTGVCATYKNNWDDFLEIHNISRNLQMCDIDKELKKAIKELTKERTLLDQKRIPFRNLKYEKIKGAGRGQGGKVIGIVFSFEPEPEVRVEFKEAQQKLEQQEQEQTQNDYFLDREALKKRLDVARYTSIYINGVSYKIEAVEPILYKTGDLVIAVSIRDEEMNPSSIQFTSEQEFFNWYESVKE